MNSQNQISKQWKLVPVEPTNEMNYAGDMGYSWNVAKIYRAMLAAAPSPPQPIYDEAKERELFMSEYPLPSGCQWSEDHQNFGWLKKSAFQRVVTYRALWTGWKACAQSRAKSGEVGHE